MAAYFDDQGQYDRVRKKCLVDSAQNRRHASQDSPTDSSILFIIGVAVITLIGLGTGVPIAMHVAQNWNMRILIVVAYGLLFGAAGYVSLKFT
ncbi:hypothetical protein C2845_PM04G14650 [Panicum miliaceum]|uniref:Uncharacterized protein n=1 Tax=Panicum miliaceum TaxID=4540 RepID=A0A3L6QXS4_PANMI|nr:hypothetical protein C2845_PM04G14650 [Panicum miliaceum]